MRILYGVVGEGMGHAIRSRVVLDELVQRHDVQVVVSGRAHDYLAARANHHLSVKKIWGFTIVTEDNEVRNFRTLLENVRGALTGGWPKNIRTYFEIADSFRPDVVISDFESWSYLYGVNHGLPVVSVDNMQIINRCRHEPALIAGHEASFQIAKGIVKAKVPGAYHYLITSFFYPPIRKSRTSLHPPILRPEILAAKSQRGEHLLVYQTYTTNQELPGLLDRLGIECRVYG
ncbi:MAG TPA: glycosyltransferase family protein, partial [Myxococcales bacterium]|nr:glycosyltransferase family protein [Myxococcales bacterium]